MLDALPSRGSKPRSGSIHSCTPFDRICWPCCFRFPLSVQRDGEGETSPSDSLTFEDEGSGKAIAQGRAYQRRLWREGRWAIVPTRVNLRCLADFRAVRFGSGVWVCFSGLSGCGFVLVFRRVCRDVALFQLEGCWPAFRGGSDGLLLVVLGKC